MNRFPDSTERDLIANATALCGVLDELLDEEHALMLARDSDRLDALLERKQQVLSDLQACEPRLRSWLADPVKLREPSLAALHRTMLDCRERNRRNREVAVIGTRRVRASIETLRRAMRMNDLELYGEDGAPVAMREKRRLGSH